MTDTKITIDWGKDYNIIKLESQYKKIVIEKLVGEIIIEYANAIYGDASTVKDLLSQQL